MIKNYPIVVDTHTKAKHNSIVVNTNDLKTVKLLITINTAKKPIDLTGKTVRIAIVKPDKKTVFQNCTITDAVNGKCEVILNTQAYAVRGLHVAEMMVYSGTDTVAVTGTFTYSVVGGILSGDTVESQNDWQAINQAIADAEGILIDLRENGTGVDAQARTDITSLNAQMAENTQQVTDAIEYGAKKANAPFPLNTPTYEHSGETTHPCVVYLPSGWNGYSYWMAHTPYPKGNDNFENPSLLVSHDGIKWFKAEGVPDPVVPEPADVQSGGYNSDPHISIVTGTMYMFYRETKADGATTTYLITSTNSKTWTARQATNLPPLTTSPSMYHDGAIWHTWFIDQNASFAVRHFTSNDGITWAQSGTVELNIPNYRNWHIEVRKFDDTFEALVTAYASVGGNNISCKLFHATSNDGLIWSVSNDGKPVLEKSVGGWDNRQIYKASFLKDSEGYRIWYGATGLNFNWFIGYTEGKEITQLVGKSFEPPYALLSHIFKDHLYMDIAKRIYGLADLHLIAGSNAAINFNYGQAKGVNFYNGGTTPKATIDENGNLNMLTGHVIMSVARHIKSAGDLHLMGSSTANVNFNYGQGKDTVFYNGGTTPKARIDENGKGRFTGGIGVGNWRAGSALGTVVRTMEVFDANNGTSLGFIPIYDSIS